MEDQVTKIIESVLNENSDIDLNVPYQRALLAELCQQALTKAVVVEVAALLGATIETDNDGQAVIYTDVNLTDPAFDDEPIHDFLG